MVDHTLLDEIQKIRDMTRRFARHELRPRLVTDSGLHQHGCLARFGEDPSLNVAIRPVA